MRGIDAVLHSIGQCVRNLLAKVKRDILTLWYIVKHPRVSWKVRVFAGVLCAYAWSPIDIIPDFIPILGYVDEMVILPIGLFIIFRLIPQDILLDCRQETNSHVKEERDSPPINHWGIVIVMMIWFTLLTFTIRAIDIPPNTLKE